MTGEQALLMAFNAIIYAQMEPTDHVLIRGDATTFSNTGIYSAAERVRGHYPELATLLEATASKSYLWGGPGGEAMLEADMRALDEKYELDEVYLEEDG